MNCGACLMDRAEIVAIVNGKCPYCDLRAKPTDYRDALVTWINECEASYSRVDCTVLPGRFDSMIAALRAIVSKGSISTHVAVMRAAGFNK